MSSSIQGLANSGLISDPTAAASASDAAEFTSAVSTSNLVVNGNTIDTGRYVVIASTDSTHGGSSTADDGQLTVYDKQTNTYVNIWGDPHLTASDGNLADFQAHGLTLLLPDGTRLEIEPTATTNGVAHIAEATVTKNGQTVLMSNFEGQAGSQVTVGPIMQGNAQAVSPTMDNVSDTVLDAGNTDIGAWSLTNGQLLTSTGSQMNLDGMGGGVELYFNNFNTAASLGMVSAEASGQAGGGSGSNAPAYAASTSTIPGAIPGAIPGTQTAVSAPSLESIQAQSNPDAGNSTATIDAMLDKVLGVPVPSGSSTQTATASAPATQSGGVASLAATSANLSTTVVPTPVIAGGSPTSTSATAVTSAVPQPNALSQPSSFAAVGPMTSTSTEQIAQIVQEATKDINAIISQSVGANSTAPVSTGVVAGGTVAAVPAGAGDLAAAVAMPVDMLLQGAGALAAKGIVQPDAADSLSTTSTLMTTLNEIFNPTPTPPSGNPGVSQASA